MDTKSIYRDFTILKDSKVYRTITAIVFITVLYSKVLIVLIVHRIV